MSGVRKQKSTIDAAVSVSRIYLSSEGLSTESEFSLN